MWTQTLRKRGHRRVFGFSVKNNVCLSPSPFHNMDGSRKARSSTPLPGESPDLSPSHSMERGMLSQETVDDQIWSSPSADTDWTTSFSPALTSSSLQGLHSLQSRELKDDGWITSTTSKTGTHPGTYLPRILFLSPLVRWLSQSFSRSVYTDGAVTPLRGAGYKNHLLRKEGKVHSKILLMV